MAKKRILFIAWDGPYVTYLESLFLPIFHKLSDSYEFHIIQFSWASSSRVRSIEQLCHTLNVPYTYLPVYVKPHPLIGKLVTLALAKYKIAAYIKKNRIEVLMPRGIIPAEIVSSAIKRYKSLQVVYDADGLQIEDRVEFANLKEGSLRYKRLKKTESAIIQRADAILTRSWKAIDFLVQQYGEDLRSRFFRVINGRNEQLFSRSVYLQASGLRSKLGIPPEAFVYVYCGTIAPQYALPEMVSLHKKMVAQNSNAYWLVLTANTGVMEPYLSLPNVKVYNVPAKEVPLYLSIANVGLALRKATPSMTGVAPIKIGEYLLMGLPVVASCGIGDSEDILARQPFCCMLPDLSESSIEMAFQWMIHLIKFEPSAIREFGIKNFGLKAAVNSYQLALDSLSA
jgi:hypothetical protein